MFREEEYILLPHHTQVIEVPRGDRLEGMCVNAFPYKVRNKTTVELVADGSILLVYYKLAHFPNYTIVINEDTARYCMLDLRVTNDSDAEGKLFWGFSIRRER